MTINTIQQEKEALDDLSMELELADEDQPVLCVSLSNTRAVIDLAAQIDIALERPSCICHSHAL